jgi:hypothetical protein
MKKPHKPSYSLFLRELSTHLGNEWDEFLWIDPFLIRDYFIDTTKASHCDQKS